MTGARINLNTRSLEYLTSTPDKPEDLHQLSVEIFGYSIKSQISFVVSSIHDDDLFHFITNPKWRRSLQCTEMTGYFSNLFMKFARVAVKNKILKTIDEILTMSTEELTANFTKSKLQESSATHDTVRDMVDEDNELSKEVDLSEDSMIENVYSEHFMWCKKYYDAFDMNSMKGDDIMNEDEANSDKMMSTSIKTSTNYIIANRKKVLRRKIDQIVKDKVTPSINDVFDEDDGANQRKRRKSVKKVRIFRLMY